jgi:hypothetical protein
VVCVGLCKAGYGRWQPLAFLLFAATSPPTDMSAQPKAPADQVQLVGKLQGDVLHLAKQADMLHDEKAATAVKMFEAQVRTEQNWPHLHRDRARRWPHLHRDRARRCCVAGAVATLCGRASHGSRAEFRTLCQGMPRTHACMHTHSALCPKDANLRSANAVSPPVTAAPIGAPFSIRRLTRQSCTRCARTQTGVRVVPSGGA